ncbi:E3 ubiquitin ligase complex SCF subunit sconC [Phycomyces blakesleeanus]|uniref:E3 ubiquitin ligase complex SCF subunit n=1 Tax=Phycomyces blakesleeanus TaxID=4837 RepID=A0ABR3APE1_PHYBL
MGACLLSSDNELFNVDKEIAERSILIKNKLEEMEESDATIPLPSVTAKTLQKVIEWCEHHREDPVTQDSQERRNTDIEEWDEKYMEVDQETLFDIILTVANMIRGRNAEDMMRIFDIPNNFTPQELVLINRENEWAEDR